MGYCSHTQKKTGRRLSVSPIEIFGTETKKKQLRKIHNSSIRRNAFENESLAQTRFHQNENIVFLGSSGVRKRHLATSIGISAAKKRISTYFIKCHDLITQLKKANIENRLEDSFTKYKLLIIDELGYLPIDKEDSKLLFQLIDRRYEKRSTIITTNINFSSWGDIFKDPVLANAILDRVFAHVVQITGKSYRLKDYYSEDK